MAAPSSFSQDVDTLAYQIVFNSESALTNLKTFTTEVKKAGIEAEAFKELIASIGEQGAMSMDKANEAVQRLTASFRGLSKEAVLPNVMEQFAQAEKASVVITNEATGAQYKWNESLGRYQDIATGQIVSLAQVDAAINANTAAKTVNTTATQASMDAQIAASDAFVVNMQAYKTATTATGQVDSLKLAIQNYSIATQTSYSDSAKAIQGLLAAQNLPTAPVNTALKELNAGLKQVPVEAIKAKSGIGILESSLKSLQHVLVGMLAFRILTSILGVFSSFTKYLNEASKAAQEFYKDLNNVVIGVREMQRQGFDVSISQITKAIVDLKKQFPIFTEAQLTSGMDNAIAKTRSMQLGYEEVIKLMTISAGMAAYTGKTIEATTDAIVNAMINTTAQSTKALAEATYLDVRQADILQSARELGFKNAEKGYAALTKQERAQATLNAAYKQYLKYQDDINTSMDTAANRVTKVDSAWADMKKNLGGVGLAIKAQLAPYLLDLIPILEKVGRTILMTAGFIVPLVSAFEALNQSFSIKGGLDIKKFQQVFQDTYAKIGHAMSLTTAGEELGREFGDNIAKGTAQGLEEGLSQDALDAIEKFSKDVEELAIDAARELEDDLIDLQRKMQDIDIDYYRKLDELAIDYARDVADANESNKDDIAKANQDYRDAELDAELKYQRELQKLRDSFLFNLEDALRERDARQVLRLTRQYKLDKKNLTDEYNDERAQRLREYQQQLADLENQKNKKLQKLAEEYKAKQDMAALDRQRAIEDANLNFQQEQEDDARHQKQKLQDLVDALAEQGIATQQGAEAVRQILNQYFGPGGYTDEIYNYFIAKIQAIAEATAAVSSMLGETGQVTAAKDLSDYFGHTKKATGGTLFASKPTSVLFGERQPEVAQFTTLSQLNTHSNANPSMPGDNGGKVRLDVFLSPDLEARIVDTASNKVATAIHKIQREK